MKTKTLLVSLLTITTSVISCKKEDSTTNEKVNVSFTNGGGCKPVKIELDGSVPSGFEDVQGGEKVETSVNPGTHTYKVIIISTGKTFKTDDFTINSGSSKGISVCGM
jgi:hypothetical protein